MCRAVRLTFVVLGCAAALECSPSALTWAGPQLNSKLPPYNDSTQLLTSWGDAVVASPAPHSSLHPNPLLERRVSGVVEQKRGRAKCCNTRAISIEAS